MLVYGDAGGEESAVQRLIKQGAEGGNDPLLDKEEGPHEVVHPVPLGWVMHNWKLGRSFFDSAKFGIVQYVSYIRHRTFIVYVLVS